MITASEEFKNNKYVYLPELLTKDTCDELAKQLEFLVLNNKSTIDEQCPKSQAVYGVPAFEHLMEQLLPTFEQVSGKKLYPTYAYARLYSPGEVLESHVDRPACEISATITLGFNGAAWPIYMGSTPEKAAKIAMAVGDAVLYKGCEVPHWREKYTEGTWQAQVFLHYVDANGPFSSQKYDGRLMLSNHDKATYEFIAIHDALPVSACQKIIDSCEAQTAGELAAIGDGNYGVIDKSIRDVRKVQLPVYRGIGATMAGIGLVANKDLWNFDITHANQCDYLRYDKDGHYKAHVDTFMDPKSTETRKLTVLVFLNDDFEGGRLFLQNGHEKIYPPQRPGTILVFPSFMVHGVEPVTKGIRRSIVTWMVGPWFK